MGDGPMGGGPMGQAGPCSRCNQNQQDPLARERLQPVPAPGAIADGAESGAPFGLFDPNTPVVPENINGAPVPNGLNGPLGGGTQISDSGEPIEVPESQEKTVPHRELSSEEFLQTPIGEGPGETPGNPGTHSP